MQQSVGIAAIKTAARLPMLRRLRLVQEYVNQASVAHVSDWEEPEEESEVDEDSDAAMMTENGGYAAGRGGCGAMMTMMMGGLDIVAALPQLRPYGADVTLMRWWNAYTAGAWRGACGRDTRGGGGGGNSARPSLNDTEESTSRISTIMVNRNNDTNINTPAHGTTTSMDTDEHHDTNNMDTRNDNDSTNASTYNDYHSSNGNEDAKLGVGSVSAGVPSTLSWHVISRAPVWLRALHRHWSQALGRGGARTTQWLLREAWLSGMVVGRVASSAALPARLVLSDALTALDELRRVITVESVDVWEVVRRQAYKAHVLRALLDARHWEEDYSHSSAAAEQDADEEHDGSDADVKDRENTLYALDIRQLRFRYPATPTVEVFDPPLSLRLVLQPVPAALADVSQHTDVSAGNTRMTTRTMAGLLICLTGRSGCGKSTLLSLLLGLYRVKETEEDEEGAHDDHRTHESSRTRLPTSLVTSASTRVMDEADLAHAASESETGAIHLQLGSPDNGRPVWFDVDTLPRHRLRRRIFAHLPQRPFIVAGATLAQNISLHNVVTLADAAVLRRVRMCCRRARCDFVARLPQGCMTRVSDELAGGGDVVTLSGGQAQRVMLARALYHGARVLLMDEPTANLDPATRREVMEEWRALLREGVVTGMICCTHDEALMQAADRVVAM